MKRLLVTVVTLASLVGAESASAGLRANPLARHGRVNPAIRWGAVRPDPAIRFGAVRPDPMIRWGASSGGGILRFSGHPEHPA
jgi:hypothetical protein